MVLAILLALGRAVRRDLATFRSLQVNNFFLFVALVAYGALETGLPPRSAYPFLLLLGFLLLFPLSSDPLARIPPERLASWPLARRQRLALRMVSLALSPVLWVAVAILLAASPVLALFFVALAAGTQGVLALGRWPDWTPRARIPPVPGRLGLLVRKDARQMLTVLDTWVAVLLSGGACCWRVLDPHPDPEAFPILAILVALALSTYAQALFGLDSAPGATRYRSLPLAGWQILLAKDAAFLGILLLLVLPLSPLPGLTFGLWALAVGHVPSLFLRVPQQRWRFTGGRLIFGLAQILPGVALAVTEHLNGPLYFFLAAAAWAVSLWACGRRYTKSQG